MERLISVEPLEVEYLYSAVKEYCPLIIDCSRNRKNPLKQVLSFKPELIIFTAYITHRDQVLQYSKEIKNLSPHVKIFVGGPHAEVCPEHFYSQHIDAVFFANQLKALQESVKKLEQGLPFSHIPGLAAPVGGVFKRNNASIELTPHLPAPERIIFDKAPEKFFYLHYKKCASVKTASGCPGSCTFCFCRNMNGGRYSPRIIEDVVAEIEAINADSILIIDDNFLVNRTRLQAFSKLILESGIKKNFIAYGTASFIASQPATISQLKDAGLKALIVGFEFIDNDELREVCKGSTAAENMAAASILDNLGIDLIALFILRPSHTRHYFRRLASFIKNNPITIATFSTETKLPGTENFNSSEKSSPSHYVKKHSWRYDLLRLHDQPKHMSAFEFYCRLYGLFLIPYLKPQKAVMLVRSFGPVGAGRAFFKAGCTGLEYLFKLLFWP